MDDADSGPHVGRVAWITGGSSGIGEAVARRLHADGAAIGVLDLQPPTQTEAAFEHCDVADSRDVNAAVERLQATTGPPDILVLSAGITATAPVVDLTDDQWNTVLNVNLTGAFNVTRAVMGGMLERRWGRIVSLTSTTAVRVTSGRAAYAASKAGLIAFTKVVALEGAEHGVTANVVAPGVTDTPMTRNAIGGSEKLRETALTSSISNPMHVVLEPHDIAHAIRFLTLPESRYITGDVIYVNAGSYMP